MIHNEMGWWIWVSFEAAPTTAAASERVKTQAAAESLFQSDCARPFVSTLRGSSVVKLLLSLLSAQRLELPRNLENKIKERIRQQRDVETRTSVRHCSYSCSIFSGRSYLGFSAYHWSRMCLLINSVSADTETSS